MIKNFFYILLVFLLNINTIKAQDYFGFQEYYLGTGYNVSYSQLIQYNFILDKFNRNTTQEKSFSASHLPNGFSFIIGTHQSLFDFNLGFSTLAQKRKSEYAIGDELYQRDVRLSINRFSLGTGVFFPTDSSMGIGAGVSADYNNFKWSTKADLDTDVAGKAYISPVKNTMYGMTMELCFAFGDMDETSTKFMIKPYYSFTFKNQDLYLLDEAVNGGPTPAGLNQRFNSFGINLLVNYSVVR